MRSRAALQRIAVRRYGCEIDRIAHHASRRQVPEREGSVVMAISDEVGIDLCRPAAGQREVIDHRPVPVEARPSVGFVQLIGVHPDVGVAGLVGRGARGVRGSGLPRDAAAAWVAVDDVSELAAALEYRPGGQTGALRRRDGEGYGRLRRDGAFGVRACSVARARPLASRGGAVRDERERKRCLDRR